MSANTVIKRVAAAFVGVMILSASVPVSAVVQEDARADYYQRALELIDKKDYSGTVILLKNTLQADGRDLNARVELANTNLKMEDGVSVIG
jgi:hypothetical protein